MNADYLHLDAPASLHVQAHVMASNAGLLQRAAEAGQALPPAEQTLITASICGALSSISGALSDLYAHQLAATPPTIPDHLESDPA